MSGFVTIPENYTASIGSVATTIIGDMFWPVALVLGVLMFIWLVNWGIELFDDMRREARISKLTSDLGISPAELQREERRITLSKERSELSALELEEVEEHYI